MYFYLPSLSFLCRIKWTMEKRSHQIVLIYIYIYNEYNEYIESNEYNEYIESNEYNESIDS